MSCCGRGGSWFKNCGRAGNAKLHHTWYEGIQACKKLEHSKRAIGLQSNAAQQLNPFDGADKAKFTATINVTTTATTRTTSITVAHTAEEEAITADWISYGV